MADIDVMRMRLAILQEQQRQAEGFIGPPVAEQGQPVAAEMSVGDDLARSAASGAVRGFTGLVDMVGQGLQPGTMEFGGIDPATGRPVGDVTYNPSNVPSAMAGVEGFAPGSTTYEPKTRGGKFTQTATEFVTGGAPLGGGVIPMVTAGLGSEALGQLTEGTRAEPWARFAGGLLGSMVPGAASKLISPYGGAKPEKLAAAAAIEKEGVKLSAGQKVGSEALQRAERGVAGLDDMFIQQSDDFTRAAMKRVGVDGLATPENLAKAQKAIVASMDDVAKGAKIKVDSTPILDAWAAGVDRTTSTLPKIFENVAMEIDDIARSGGVLSGSRYRALRSDLSKMTKSMDEAVRSTAIRMVETLDDALQASVGSEAAAKLASARGQYRDFLAIEKAASAAGEQAALGYITPARLSSAVKTQNARQFTQQTRDLAQLARNGVAAITTPRSSGTAENLLSRIGPNITRAGAGAGVAGGTAGLLGLGPAGVAASTAAGLLAPALRNGVIRFGQGYLANQAMRPINPLAAVPAAGAVGLLQ